MTGYTVHAGADSCYFSGRGGLYAANPCGFPAVHQKKTAWLLLAFNVLFILLLLTPLGTDHEWEM